MVNVVSAASYVKVSQNNDILWIFRCFPLFAHPERERVNETVARCFCLNCVNCTELSCKNAVRNCINSQGCWHSMRPKAFASNRYKQPLFIPFFVNPGYEVHQSGCPKWHFIYNVILVKIPSFRCFKDFIRSWHGWNHKNLTNLHLKLSYLKNMQIRIWLFFIWFGLVPKGYLGNGTIYSMYPVLNEM